MDEHWTDRLRRELENADITAAELDRRANLPDGRARTYLSKRNNAPRGDILERYAAALGVEALWLEKGLPPRRVGENAPPEIPQAAEPPPQPHAVEPHFSGDHILMQRLFGERVKGARLRRGISTPEAAALGTIINGRRWRLIEEGHVAAHPLESRVISERLHTSLDWIIGGNITPIDDHDPIETERVRRHLQEVAPSSVKR